MIEGTISANNFIRSPHVNSSVKSLGLTGRFVYIQLQSVPEQPFTIHLDYKVEGRNNLRVSLSNLFKQITQPNDFAIQFPLQLNNAWSTVCIDI